MLDTLTNFNGFVSSPASVSGDFPAELLACADAENLSEISNLGHCPLDGCRALCMEAALLYDPCVILLQCPMLFCTRQKRLAFPSASALDERLALIDRNRLVPLSQQTVGIGGVATRPWLGGHLAATLKAVEISYSPEAHALIGDGLKQGHAALPSGVLFHGIGLPDVLTVKIEPTTHCNFHCGFCYGRHLPQASLSLQKLRFVLENIPGLRSVELTGEGEPLVHSHIWEMVQECKRCSLWLHITSNGSLLTEDRLHRLFGLGLDSLAISLESIQPERFARFRPGGKLETVLASIRAADRIRRSGGYKVSIKLWVTILRETVQELSEIRNFAQEAGVDIMECQPLNPKSTYSRFYTADLLANLMSAQEIRTMMSDPATPPQVVAMLADSIAVTRNHSCDVFMNMVMADVEGNYLPCCLLKSADFTPFGNLVNQSFLEIWSLPRFKNFRFALQHGILLRSCMGCLNVESAFGMNSIH